MPLTPEMIDNYFARFGWEYTRMNEKTWVTGVRTTVASFRIYVRLTEHWVHFVINPYVITAEDLDIRLRLYYHILRFNLDMSLAKFGLDRDGDVFLAAELPTEDFQYSHFADALNGISHYAESMYSEIFNLAHNPELIDGRYDDELPDELFEGFEDSDEEAALSEIDSGDEFEDALPFDFDKEDPRPLDDIDLPAETEATDNRAIIAGREVKIIDDENGMRIEFETMNDLDEPSANGESSEGESSTRQDGQDEDE